MKISLADAVDRMTEDDDVIRPLTFNRTDLIEFRKVMEWHQRAINDAFGLTITNNSQNGD